MTANETVKLGGVTSWLESGWSVGLTYITPNCAIKSLPFNDAHPTTQTGRWPWIVNRQLPGRKIEVKTLHTHTEGVWRRRVIAPHILNLRTTQLHAAPTLPRVTTKEAWRPPDPLWTRPWLQRWLKPRKPSTQSAFEVKITRVAPHTHTHTHTCCSHGKWSLLV